MLPFENLWGWCRGATALRIGESASSAGVWPQYLGHKTGVRSQEFPEDHRGCSPKNSGGDSLELRSNAILGCQFIYLYVYFVNVFLWEWEVKSPCLVFQILEHTGLGKHPHEDPWSKPFSKTYCPDRLKLAGSALAGPFTFVLDGIQGDADFVASLFSLKRVLLKLKGSKSQFFIWHIVGEIQKETFPSCQSFHPYITIWNIASFNLGIIFT